MRLGFLLLVLLLAVVEEFIFLSSFVVSWCVGEGRDVEKAEAVEKGPG